MIGTLAIIEQIKQGVCVDPPCFIETRVVQDGKWLLRVVERRVVRVLGLVVTRLFRVPRFGAIGCGGREKALH